MRIKEKIFTYFLYAALFISGAVVLIIEIAGARLLSPFYGSTIFVWSSLIAITLGFLALGYFVGGFFADKYPRPECFYFIIALGGASALLLIKLSQPILVYSDKFGFKLGPLVAAKSLFALPLFLLSMAGPFAIRLTSKELKHTGHTSGLVFGISTAGSLVGALLTGFFLVPNLFLSTIFVFSLTILASVAVAGLFISKAPQWMLGVSIGLLVLSLLLPFLGKKSDEHVSVIYSDQSFYGDIRVIEHLGQRCLEVNSSGQTCISAKNKIQTLSYVRLINSLFRAVPFVELEVRYKNLLVLGLGGGVLPRDLKGRFESVDAVEIDPKMIQVAKEFFDYDDENTNIDTHIADARSFVKKSDKRYDVIIVDVFSGANPAPHLFTKEAFKDMENILAEGGMVIINTIGHAYGEKDVLAQSVYKTLNEVFPYNGVLSTESVVKNPEELSNVLFVSSREPRGFAINKDFIVGYKEPAEEAKIFTDDRNAIETLSASIAGEVQERYKDFLEKS